MKATKKPPPRAPARAEARGLISPPPPGVDRARREPVTLRALAALDSPYERVHLQALARVTEALLPAARSESSVDASLRSFAAERLWENMADLRFAESDSVAALKDLLADSDPSVRSLAARALDYGGHYWAE